MMIVPNLLVTDDDGALRSLLCEALSRSGFQVLQAADGHEALEVLGRHTVHFALVDVHMPRVTGLELMRSLADLPNRPPCALMSADLTDRIVAEAKQMNVYRVLPKPIRIHQIREVVRGALKDTYGWSAVG